MKKNLNVKKQIQALVTLGALLVISTSCGRQSFTKATLEEQGGGPGHFTVPAKIDVILFEDDTGSMIEGFNAISNQLPGFLGGLEAKGWDYRYATSPLTQSRALDQILASRFDGNWGSEWREPFPGASISALNSTFVNPAYFRFPESSPQYSHFLTASDITNHQGGSEPGFTNIKNALLNEAPITQFFRPDALSVIVVLSTEDDSSGSSNCIRSDGWVDACWTIEESEKPFYTDWREVQCLVGTNIPTRTCFKSLQKEQEILADFAADFQNLTSSQQSGYTRFFSAVSFGHSSNCLGAESNPGTRYRKMADLVGGASFNLCSGDNAIERTLNALDQELENIRLSQRTRFVILEREPDPSSIQFSKNGDEFPESGENGWKYRGYQTEMLIDHPRPLNQQSGFMIELHGDAKLLGSDTYSLTYKPLEGGDVIEN